MKKIIKLIYITLLCILFTGCGKASIDGIYDIPVTLNGGSGRAGITSPTEVTIKDGAATAKIEWSSPNYDYMIVNGEKLLNQSTEGNSVFTIPVDINSSELNCIADTVAMSVPHEIEYTLSFDFSSITGDKATSKQGGEASVTLDENPKEASKDIPQIVGHKYIGSCNFEYAELVQIFYYDDFSIIRINNDTEYLLINKDAQVPEIDGSEYTVIYKTVNIYNAATSAMALFGIIDDYEHIGFDSLDKDSWYVDSAKEAMDAGRVIYAGKYSQPDYERLLTGGCSMALESTMILHAPQVKEKLEELNIPVMIDYSNHEATPLGRLEWVKVYGELTDRQNEAESFFKAQKSKIENIKSINSDTKTVAYFYVSQTGTVITKKTNDYVVKMIELAGGEYIFPNLTNDNAASSINMTFEDFYSGAKDADYLVYNATIDNPINSTSELLDKNSLFADFKAVKEGNGYCSGKNMYQASDSTAEIIMDFNRMLTGNSDFTFLYKLD